MATTHWYVDDTASAGNTGTSPTDAWESIETAMEHTFFIAANVNKVWIRRTTSFTFTASDIVCADAGYDDRPILFIGWPRAVILNTEITQGDWTNGSNLVDNVVGITPDREKHVGRWATAPDGNKYLITAVLWEAVLDGIEDGVSEFTVESKLTNTTQTKYGKVWGFTDDGGTAGTIQYYRHPSSAWVENDNLTDADAGDGEITAAGETAVGFIIDRPYAGSTVTTTNGKFQIEADEDWADRPTWAAADGDADDLPLIDGDNLGFCILIDNGDYFFWMKNIEFKDGNDSSYGIIYFNLCYQAGLSGCLFSQDNGVNRRIMRAASCAVCIDRCIAEGSGAVGDTLQDFCWGEFADIKITNAAILGMGNHAIVGNANRSWFLENVNIGIEAPNADDDISLGVEDCVFGKDVQIGGINGYLYTNRFMGPYSRVSFENYQKVLGDHKTWYSGGEYVSTVLTGATTPNKKLSDTVLKITPNINDREFYVPDLIHRIPLGEINADAGSQTFSFWVHNLTGVTLNDTAATDDIFLQAEYVESYSATPTPDAHTTAIATSTLIDIVDQAGNPDTWVSLGVTCNPATTSKVRLWLCVRIYDTNDIFIDPQVVIT